MVQTRDEFITRLIKKIDDYDNSNPKEIPTCDTADLRDWIEEVKQ